MIRILIVGVLALWVAWCLAFAVDLTISGDPHPGDTSIWLVYEDAGPDT